jgi:predicted nucleic acid-binding protein
MTQGSSINYCLDANVLIQAWQKYYSRDLCPDYWDNLNQLGEEGRIIVPKAVYDEIIRTEDDLSSWLKDSKIPISPITESTTKELQNIFNSNPKHKHLVDNIKARSLADPWIIAHAIDENLTVVTKEEKVTQLNSRKINS